jgi:aryl-alcohol dehydrogenase-like predicted oxidoreductase
MTDKTLTAVADLKPVASDCGLTMAQLAVAWVLQNPSVSAALVGASRPEQVIDNVAASGVRLDADVLEQIDKILADVIERDSSKTSSPNPRP